jgi:hypothetical protein
MTKRVHGPARPAVPTTKAPSAAPERLRPATKSEQARLRTLLDGLKAEGFGELIDQKKAKVVLGEAPGAKRPSMDWQKAALGNRKFVDVLDRTLKRMGGWATSYEGALDKTAVGPNAALVYGHGVSAYRPGSDGIEFLDDGKLRAFYTDTGTTGTGTHKVVDLLDYLKDGKVDVEAAIRDLLKIKIDFGTPY